MRDQAGRWAKGNPGGPGRPRRMVEVDYIALTADIAGPHWGRVVQAAVELAVSGDARAREWLARYLLGEPRDGVLVRIAGCESRGVDPGDEQVESAASDREIADALLRSLAGNQDEGA